MALKGRPRLWACLVAFELVQCDVDSTHSAASRPRLRARLVPFELVYCDVDGIQVSHAFRNMCRVLLINLVPVRLNNDFCGAGLTQTMILFGAG